VREIALALMRGLAERGARTGWAASAAGALRYAIRGPGEAPEALLLHGLGDSLAGWAQVVGPLSRVLRVHAIDLPGHGMSEQPPDWRLPTLASAVAQYARGLRDPLIVGHSLGGWLGLRAVLSGAVRPRAIVLVNPGGATLAQGLWAPFRELVAGRDRAAARRYLAHAFHRAPLPLRLFPGEVTRAMSAEACGGVLDAIREEDFLGEPELSRIEVPVRLVWGAADRLLPEGSFDFFRRALPRAEVVVLPGSGHLPHLETPKALVRALLAPFPPGRSR
jgi:pimeloyl-ACP methyl ester carboxylesterase